MSRTNGPKDTPERRDRILQALRAGNTRGASCAYAGMSADTFARAMQRSADFAEAVKEAEASAEVRHVANIAKAAGDGIWTASAWWLERRRHEEWRKREEVQHTGKDGAALPIVVMPLPPMPSETGA
jgi:hypothetical protein